MEYGQTYLCLPYSGEYDFVDTSYVFLITHMVYLYTRYEVKPPRSRSGRWSSPVFDGHINSNKPSFNSCGHPQRYAIFLAPAKKM
ncbi:hypothetical protein DO021_19200 [Desulfobacter hydrogenophilus]|uniref:Uncharacterized protein n=1 Tax=Desulfobacter hydrogenophilus TaxID=2291 RepID=A0A328F9R6_9BACT|nr:hypothetical protein [Desulfobacter hydrogenophilus]QBH15638.1 hypothetical protein EYB58_17735 [Desulfobacter hydrogenophilus]RAM00410.1 hypothetical protein DO021_19200 [Desulfobacter hydrogenophilus]